MRGALAPPCSFACRDRWGNGITSSRHGHHADLLLGLYDAAIPSIQMNPYRSFPPCSRVVCRATREYVVDGGQVRGGVLMGRAWGLAGAYAGAIIGAGFASGQELLFFFGAFGPSGLWGLALAGLVFTVIGGSLFEYARKVESGSHEAVLVRLCGANIGHIVDTVLSAFLFASLGVMLAAAGALFADHLRRPFALGVGTTALLTGAIARNEPTRMLRLNGAIVTLLVLSLLVVLLPVIGGTYWPVTSRRTLLPVLAPSHWWSGAVLYSAFNLVLALSPIGALGREVRSPVEAFLGAALGSVVLILTGAVVLLALLRHPTLIAEAELPLLSLLVGRLPAAAAVYAFVLYLALLTSCVAITYGLGHRAAGGDTVRARRIAGWLPLAAMPLSYLGFSNLVHSLYPLIGYTGLGLLLFALIRRLLA